MGSFKIYGIWAQASKQPSKHAGMLVWGSLRLAPNNSYE